MVSTFSSQEDLTTYVHSPLQIVKTERVKLKKLGLVLINQYSNSSGKYKKYVHSRNCSQFARNSIDK